MDDKGTIVGGFNLQTIAVIGLIAFFVAAYLGYIDIPGITPERGNVTINLGYVLENGTEVELLTNETAMMLYIDPVTLRWYKDSSKSVQISALWGKLSVRPTTDLNTTTVNVVWSREVWCGYAGESPVKFNTGGGTKAVPPNASTVIEDSKYTHSLPISGLTGGYSTPILTYYYNVTASATDPRKEVSPLPRLSE